MVAMRLQPVLLTPSPIPFGKYFSDFAARPLLFSDTSGLPPPKFSILNSARSGPDEPENMAHLGEHPSDMGPHRAIRFRDIHAYFIWRDMSKLRRGLVIAAIAGVVVLIFQDKIKGYFGEQGAEVASRTMQDERLQRQAEELSAAVVKQVLNNPDLLAAATRFLTWLAAEPGTRDAVIVLLRSVAANSDAQVVLGDLGRQLLRRPEVQETATELAKQLAHTVLADPAVNAHAKELVRGVFADSHVQVSAGEGLWSAFKFGFLPRWATSRPPPPRPPVVSPSELAP
jgi:hypothetical protein